MNPSTLSALGMPLTRDAGDAPSGLTRQYDFELNLDRASIDEEARTITASLSSEAPVERFFGTEVLRHTKDAVDLARGAHGLPLLFNHDRDAPLGVVRALQVVDGRLRGTLHFAKSARALEMWDQVREGFLNNMSIGYRIQKVEEAGDTHTATRWTLLEASVVTVPADPAVGVGRDAPALPRGATRDDDDTVVDYQATRRQAHAAGREEGQRLERARIDGIRELFVRERFQSDAYRALCEDLIDEGVTVVEAQRRLLDAIGDGVAPVAEARSDRAGGGHSAYVSAGADTLDKFMDGAGAVLSVRGQIERDESVVRAIRSNELYGHDLTDLAREYLQRGGLRLNGLSKMQIVGEAFTRVFVPSHGVSSFANLLGNTAEKAMMVGWDQAAETWQVWCREGRLPDFKTADRVGMSGFSGLDEIPASGEYKLGAFADLKETIRLATYGKLFNINRQAIINDDLAAFTMIPMKQGEAANRKIGDVVYDLLVSNSGVGPTLNQDATALFDISGHGNYVTSGAAPNVATLTTGFTAMATQTAPSPDGGTTAGHRVNVRPRYLLVPVALEIAAKTLVAAQYDPAGSAGTLTPNPFQNTLTVVADARLDAYSATGWYLAAAPMQLDTFEVAFLDGERRPFLDQQDGWNIDGVSYKVRVDAGVSALDYRGLYYNDGAT